MKIIGYNASPRNNGNTAWTIAQILESAKKQGADVEIWHSGELDINPCRRCLGCTKICLSPARLSFRNRTA